MSSTINSAYFGMTKIELQALVATGQPDQVNAAQSELDRRRANKAAKRATRAANMPDLIEQEQTAQAESKEAIATVSEPIAN